MCVSADFCDAHLPLLLTILKQSKNPVIRSNIIITFGDMAVSFSTLIDENVHTLYDCLSDADRKVKKTALMVLTHLILNGMVKVKGQLGKMARCLEDDNEDICNMAKLFFSELASKDSAAVYNNIPDIISTLSLIETPDAAASAVKNEAAAEKDMAVDGTEDQPVIVKQEDKKSAIIAGCITQDAFRRIVKFIFNFLKKVCDI